MREHIDLTFDRATDADLAGRAESFERHRARLFGIAYRMLGSVDDANDLVQETYLRWHRADVAEIRAPEGWLVAVMTRLSIDRLRRSAVERERYVGDWLPEPLVTAPHATDRGAELASDLSMAFLVLLERLAPEERAAFLLREVFDADYAEIARVLERSEPACRQMVHRARERVRTERTRFTVAPETRERLVSRFLEAIRTEDRESLLALVAPDATWTSDGGGRVSAARRVITGRDRVVRLILGVERKWGALVRYEIAWINGEPALLSFAGDHLFATTSIDTDGERLTGFYRVLNPEKLRNVVRGGS
ncbi:MAG TPA: RNA polymerase sigma-70 factor [Gemmatimonadaceae bacterium]|jgi:RNA polymerase sigma-70 factor (ECF subfamily)|nr:RNA polymerase sigma-70 factor [Gemmatimonadaceae bacterium]